MIYYGALPNGLIKIGYTANSPAGRASQIAAAHPGFTLLAAREGDFIEEQRTHRMFAHLQQSPQASREREWFVAAPELLLHIISVARGDDVPVLETPPMNLDEEVEF